MATLNRCSKQKVFLSILLLGIVMVCIYTERLYFQSETIKERREKTFKRSFALEGEIQPLTETLQQTEADVYYSIEKSDQPQIESERSLPVKLDEEDKKLVKQLLSRMISLSSRTTVATQGFEYEKSPHGIVVRKLTNYKTGGFFVECGAGNSHTQFLERHLGWSGLIVEADPSYSRAIQRQKRRSWFAPFCMSLNTSVYNAYIPNSMSFRAKTIPNLSYTSYKVKCYPFHMFVLALNVTAVDFFSLDVEGDELDVLKTVPFNKVNITVISVAFSKSPNGLVGVKESMERYGYRIVTEVTPDDLIFVKKDYKIPINV